MSLQPDPVTHTLSRSGRNTILKEKNSNKNPNQNNYKKSKPKIQYIGFDAYVLQQGDLLDMYDLFPICSKATYLAYESCEVCIVS